MTQDPNSHGLQLFAGNVGVLILSEAATATDFASQWAYALHNSGITVQLPVLTTHAESWSDINADDLQEWLTISEQALAILKNHCTLVFIIGISMASTVVLRLSELLGEEVNGVILVEPSLPIDRFALRKTWRTIDEELYLLEQPLMIFHSGGEHEENSQAISRRVTSPFIREITLQKSFADFLIIFEETAAFITEIADGFWLADLVPSDDNELIDAEFQSIIAGLSLDESSPSNFLDDLERPDPDEHFQEPNPKLEPIHSRSRRNAIIAMILGPIYLITAAMTGFDPFGIEPWPGILLFIGGLISFFYFLQDGEAEDDGAIL